MAHPDIIEFGEHASLITESICSGECRLVPRSMISLDNKLQQRWRVTEYRDGKPVAVRDEWRDVPVVTNP